MQFATYHVFQCPPWQRPEQVMQQELERAVLSEQLGYDGIWVAEQHFAPYCLTGDALLLAGVLASRTTHVHVGTAVVNLTFTHPLRFAERVALLDHLTGGRVEVGVGRGYQFPQYGVFGVPIDETRAIFDEALDIVLRAWEAEDFTYDGKYFQLPRVQVWPVPQRRPDEVLLHAVNSAESVESSRVPSRMRSVALPTSSRAGAATTITSGSIAMSLSRSRLGCPSSPASAAALRMPARRIIASAVVFDPAVQPPVPLFEYSRTRRPRRGSSRNSNATFHPVRWPAACGLATSS